MYFFIISFFSRMPELHISGRFLYHNSSLENSAIGASFNTSSSYMVTGLSQNSTIAISIPTNTLDSENLFCGIVSFKIYFCFALIIMIAIGIGIVRKRRMMKTRKSQESNESVETDSLSPLNSMRNCN